MAQTPSASYADLDLSPSKSPDFILAIAGWPTLYSVTGGSYAVPAAGAGLALSQANGFSAVRKWAKLPVGAGSKLRSSVPEAGGTTIGNITIEVLDRYDATLPTPGTSNANGQLRQLRDLLSRESYLLGLSPGQITTLGADISPTQTTQILVASTAGFPANGVLYIGQECIKYVGTDGTHFGTSSITRGYLLTSPVAHLNGVEAYSFKPALTLSKAYLFKGYQELTLDLWLPAFGGTIVDDTPMPGSVSLEVRATTWETYADAKRTIAALKPPTAAAQEVHPYFSNSNTYVISEGDYQVTLTLDGTKWPAPTGLGDGHYAFQIGGIWFGIQSLVSEVTSAGVTTIVANVVKGLGGSKFTSEVHQGISCPFAWSNVNFNTLPLVGSDPIDFLLQLLTSVKGDGANGTYDVFKRGIGLGIPQDRVDVSTFTAIQGQNDYDTSAKVYFLLDRPEQAKAFCDNELCKPFGWYLTTGNDGRIKLVRPKHPQKFYVSRSNNSFTFNAPTGGGNAKTAIVASGVYSGEEIASSLQTAMNAVSSGFTVTYSTVGHTFTIARGAGFDITSGSPGKAWDTVGASNVTNSVSYTGAARGAFAVRQVGQTTYNQLDMSKVLNALPVPNRKDQVVRVRYSVEFAFTSGPQFFFGTAIGTRPSVHLSAGVNYDFTDSRHANLSDVSDARTYAIASKGLVLSNLAQTGSKWTVWGPPVGGSCDGVKNDVSSSYGLDAVNSFASLFAAMMLDRYRNPPERFRCRLPWRFNTLELGDVLQVTAYGDLVTFAGEGIFVDRETNRSYLLNRLFEIVDLQPNWAHGFLDAELLGHRYVDY